MKYIFLLPLLLSACATVTTDATQNIMVTTTPAGATCTLTNRAGSWTIEETPSTILVVRNFSPLVIDCEKDGKKGSATLEPSTRLIAYGNLLMFGLPAMVDAATGEGYEYKIDSATITLK